jgi:hypothetical protein
VKPFWGVTVRVVWPLDPCWTVRLVGLRERVKSGGGGGAVTTTVRSASRVRLPEMPRTLRRWVPVGVEDEALTVRVWFTGFAPETWTLWGERLRPWGTGSCPAARERETVPVKPFCGVRVRVVWPLPPCWTVRLVGFRERVKLGGGGGAFTVRVRSRSATLSP